MVADHQVEALHAAPGRKWQASALLVLYWLVIGVAHAAPEFPALTGRVVDEAGLLSAATREQLTQLSEQYERTTSNQLVIVTVKSLQGYPVEDYGYQLGRHWGIGQKGRNNGVLLIVAPNEREVRIEVGYGLEGQLTDALASHIIQGQILPAFKSGDYEGGIVAGVQAIVAVFAGEALPAAAEAAAGISASQMPIPALLIFGVVVGQILAMFLSRIFAGTLAGVIAAAVVWFISGTLLMSVFAAIVIFIFVALSGRGGGISRMGGGGGGFGGGGFSGGGGSFGGGGASGRW